MEENKIDIIIKEKLKNRKIEVSPSAWERLENSLEDSQIKKEKRNYKLTLSIAASIVLLLSIFLFQNSNEKTSPIEEDVLVEAPILIEDLEEKEIKNVIIENVEEVLPKEETQLAVKEEPNKKKKRTVFKEKEIQLEDKLEFKDLKEIVKENETGVAEAEIKKEKKNIERVLNNQESKRIRINSDDLLYAVTHSDEEVKTYYAKLKLNRTDVLDTIKKQLKMSNLKVNPETILVEVERSIEDDEFNGKNFMQKLKVKISDIAVAIADRNK